MIQCQELNTAMHWLKLSGISSGAFRVGGLRDSDAISDSLKRPGIMYVNERNPDSIDDTAL